MKKIPSITLLFWIMKICATTLGETAGDLLSMTLNTGYAVSTVILMVGFLMALFAQLSLKKYVPAIYWLVILSTSTAGTTMSDFMDRTMGLGYALGSIVLVFLLCLVLFLWFKLEKSVSVSDIKTKRGEWFYWIAILVSNTLGTALGDYLADNSGLGFGGGAILIGSLLTIIAFAYYYTKISSIVLFWIAFVLTRPFGATFGDLLTKTNEKGGLNFGTIGSSSILFSILFVLVCYTSLATSQQQKNKL